MLKYVIESADFKLFAVLWNQQQGHKTPVLHLKMADWLERAFCSWRFVARGRAASSACSRRG